MTNEPTGVVFEFQRWSIHDGPGVRTLVFLKGCPLKCRWCCNPESQTSAPQIMIRADKCLGCGRCVAACPEAAAGPAAEGGFIDRGFCRTCGLCVEACPTGARVMTGREIGVDQALAIIRRDAAFYRASGGGVTFSGGEPLAQPEFLNALIDGCRAGGIRAVIETCGYFEWAVGGEILEKVDLVYLDIKHMDSARHQRLTGVGNELILKNAVRIAEANIPLVVRIPVIPSFNDSFENLAATAEFVRQNLTSAREVELMPYHRLGLNKYAGLGREYELEGIEPPDEVRLARLRRVIKKPTMKVA